MKYRRGLKLVQLIVIILLVSLAIWGLNRYGVAQLQHQVEQWGIWAPVGIFLLRFTSVVIPALPGTAYAILAGGLLGFGPGVLTICLADVGSCSLSFWIARRFGRKVVQRFVGQAFMGRLDRLSQRHLERNFFLMTGFLMTGFFDFVCYGLGMTRVAWLRFIPALAISIALSNPPFVALGAGLLEGSRQILVFALLGVFGIAVVTALVRRHSQSP